MIRNILGLTILALIALLQITVVNFFPYPPQLIFVLSLALFFSDFKRAALWTAFLGGLVLGLFSLIPLGLFSLIILLILTFLSGLKRFYPSSLFSFILVAFLASFLFRSTAFIFAPAPALKQVITTSLADALTLLLTFPAVRSVAKVLLRESAFQLSFKDHP